MTQLADQSIGDAGLYQARQSVLYQIRDALQAAAKWDDFLAALEARGLPEARIRQIVDVPVPMDLHLHSTHSDGQVPAQKLAWLARVIGLRTIALADHDSISGTRALYGEAMLLGLAAIPAVELSTGQPGLEILVYFPDAGRFFDFLTTPRGSRFAKFLEARQEEIHAFTLKVLESVNRWLKRQGIPSQDHITVEELDAWFGGQKPYFPGTLAVLGLKRLSEAERMATGIHDPRLFNTKVVTPALKRIAAIPARVDLAEATADVRKQLAALRRARADSVAILSHPKELVTKGRMSLGQVARTLERLVKEIGLDGVEIGCSRDGEVDVPAWQEMVDETNAKIAAGEIDAPGRCWWPVTRRTSTSWRPDARPARSPSGSACWTSGRTIAAGTCAPRRRRTNS